MKRQETGKSQTVVMGCPDVEQYSRWTIRSCNTIGEAAIMGKAGIKAKHSTKVEAEISTTKTSGWPILSAHSGNGHAYRFNPKRI